jgi:hypothetical protein
MRCGPGALEHDSGTTAKTTIGSTEANLRLLPRRALKRTPRNELEDVGSSSAAAIIRRPLRDLEHLGQSAEYHAQVPGTEDAEPLAEPLPVNGAHLIECNPPVPAPEPADGPERVGVPARGHWGDDHCLQVVIQLVGRDNETGPSLANLAAASGIEFDEHDLTAAWHADGAPYRHSHSAASNAGPGVSMSPSSPRA